MTVSQRPPIECLLVDLDDTLYDVPEMSRLVAEKIREYMVARLDVPQSEVEEMCRELYLNFGTTLSGLVASGYKVDYQDWHDYVHGTIPYEKYLKPDPKLKHLLDSIPVQKYIFTNADITHAIRCLDLLDIRSCFQPEIICFESIMGLAEENGLAHIDKNRDGQITPVVCKPNRHAFELALQQANGAEVSTTAFFDDSTRNITSAHRLGIYSILIGRVGVDCASDMQMKSMHDIPGHLPWLIQVCDGRPSFDLNTSALSSPVREDVMAEETAITVPA